MGYGSSVYKSAGDRLAEKRLAAEKRADMRRAEIYSKLPRARELEHQIASCGLEAAKTVLRGGDVVAEMTMLRDKNLALQDELSRLLTENGYDKNSLEPQYSCSKCSDTGYFEQGAITVMCDCMKRELVNCAWEKIYKFCRAYAHSFTPDSGSILMKGATGLGKTHLSLAIANEVIRRGYGVIYVSAPALLSKLEKEYFSRGTGDSNTIQMLTDCDLLIIDDLGTEFRTQFSVSQIYNLLNARMLAGKPFIINTNLTMPELEKAYSNRFVSRINGDAQKLDFLGSDLRVKRK